MIQTDKILVEHWPLLQCVNILIRFTEKLTNGTDSITVSVTKTEISLQYDDSPLTTIQLADYFELQTHSLSLLMIEQNYVSFRLNTNTDDRFGMEYIVRDDCSVRNPLTGEPFRLQMSILPNDQFSIACDNCTCPLSKQLAFQRILELPSENLDLNEWFCHKPHQLLDVNDNSEMPNGNECSSSSSVAAAALKQFNANKFEPQTMDLLHGHFFVVIAIDKLANVKQRNDTIYCRRCLQHIGEMHRQTSAKIWNENVRVVRSNNEQRSAASALAIDGDRLFDRSASLFANFMFIIRKTLQDFNFAHDVGMRPMNKILFEAKSTDGHHCRYLFVQILKRNLNVYVSRRQQSEEELDNDATSRMVRLDHVDAMKIQFRTVEQCEQRASCALLDFWQNDAGVVQYQISRRMFGVAAKRLYTNSELVAECYRHSNEGFLLSYVM